MVISDHTAKAFDIDLQELTRLVAEMGGLAEKQVADAVDALAERDADRAQRTVASDPEIDALQAEIEEKAVLTIARRQPMAVDLRVIVGALRITSDLERIAQNSESKEERARAVSTLSDESQETSRLARAIADELPLLRFDERDMERRLSLAARSAEEREWVAIEANLLETCAGASELAAHVPPALSASLVRDALRRSFESGLLKLEQDSRFAEFRASAEAKVSMDTWRAVLESLR